MPAIENPNQIVVQAKFFDFALDQLVRIHRDAFHPLWTLDSWVKFLIWMTLNCGLSGEKESLEKFAEALGAPLTSRMRRIFFERTVESLSIRVMADPADLKVLLMPIGEAVSMTFDQAEQALNQLGLLPRVELDKRLWQVLDAVIAIPWKSIEEIE